MIYTSCDHIHQEKNGITFRRIVEVVPYTTVATYIPTRRGVKVELDVASDLLLTLTWARITSPKDPIAG